MASRNITPSVRFIVLARDHFRCRYCGRAAPTVVLHVDHIHPHSKGGSGALGNLVTACQDCNLGKGATLLPVPATVRMPKTIDARLLAALRRSVRNRDDMDLRRDVTDIGWAIYRIGGFGAVVKASRKVLGYKDGARLYSRLSSAWNGVGPGGGKGWVS